MSIFRNTGTSADSFMSTAVWPLIVTSARTGCWLRSGCSARMVSIMIGPPTGITATPCRSVHSITPSAGLSGGSYTPYAYGQ
jgi:hypothetical protein